MSTRQIKRRLGNLHIETVMSYPDRRRVHYYRYSESPGGPAVGSARQFSESEEMPGWWRVLTYGPDPKRPHDGREEVGIFPTRHAAEAALYERYGTIMAGDWPRGGSATDE